MNNSEKENFFQEGAKSYVKALLAIRDYEKIVQDISKRTLLKKVKELEVAMEVPPLNPTAINPFTYEDLKTGWAAIGVSIYVPDYGTFDVGADLGDGKEIKAYVTFGLGSVWLKDQIVKATINIYGTGNSFIENNPDREVYVESPLEQIDTQTFSIVLEKLLDVWIQFWKQAGGIKKVIDGI